MKFELVIFDMDGLLVDTERLYEKTFLETLSSAGYKADKALYALTIGAGNERTRALLRSSFGADFPAEKFEELFYAASVEHIRKHGLPARPGAFELIEHLGARGVKKAVASSNDRDFVTFALERAGMGGIFEVINTAQDVAKTKPAPDLFLKTASDFNMPHEKCVVFEDSENGILAAAAAGIKVCLVPDLKMPPPEVLAKTYKIYQSLHEAKEMFF